MKSCGIVWNHVAFEAETAEFAVDTKTVVHNFHEKRHGMTCDDMMCPSMLALRFFATPNDVSFVFGPETGAQDTQ